MAFRYFAAALLAGIATAASAQSADESSLPSKGRADVNGLAKSVTDALIAGDAKRAVEIFAATSSLMASKTIELGALQGQIQTALTAYGKIGSFELAEEQTVGISMVRRYYLARHQNLVTRWEFVFSRTSSGWIISYMGFDDQQRNWFAK